MRRSAKKCGENAELRKGCGDLRYGRRMLAHSHQNWNNQHWSHAIFAGESRVSFYHSANPVSWMQRSPSLSTTRRNTRAQPLQLTRVNSLVNIRWALLWRHNGRGSVSNHQAYPGWTKVMVDHKTFSAGHEGVLYIFGGLLLKLT